MLAALLVLALPFAALAMPANPEPITQLQPDGTQISVRMYGDEKGSIYTDLSGNVVLMDQESTWKYVLKSGEEYLLGGVVQPDGAPDPDANTTYVLMEDLSNDNGQERLTALKKTLLTTAGATDQPQESKQSNAILVICIASALVIAAIVLILILKKRKAQR